MLNPLPPDDADAQSAATAWAMRHLRDLLASGQIGYREAADRTLAACQDRGILPDIAGTVTLQGFIYLGRKVAHQTRQSRSVVTGSAPVLVNPDAPIAIETKVRSVAQGKAQCLLSDWRFMIPGVGMVPLGDMTGDMVLYQRTAYYDRTRSNAAYARFFDCLAGRMAAGAADSTVGQVFNEEEVVAIAEKNSVL